MDVGRGPDPNVKLFSKIGLATERLRAIDLSCRACGAGAGRWAWIPGGGLRCAPVFTPNLRYGKCKYFIKHVTKMFLGHIDGSKTKLNFLNCF